MQSAYSVVNIRELLNEVATKDGDELILRNELTRFSCPQNSDVESFLRNNAIEFTRKQQSVTYLVFDFCLGDMVGYFTLAVKPVSIRLEKMSKTMVKKLSRVSILDVNSMTFNAAAYLIAQLGKNYALTKEKQITGADLLRCAVDTISDIQYSIGGVVQFLECEDNEFLLDFYEKNYFKPFDTRLTVSEEGETRLLHQLLRFI